MRGRKFGLAIRSERESQECIRISHREIVLRADVPRRANIVPSEVVPSEVVPSKVVAFIEKRIAATLSVAERQS